MSLWQWIRDAFMPTEPAITISGQLISIGEDRNIVIWDASSGERKQTIALPEYIEFDCTSGCGVHSQLSCGRDGRTFAACSGYVMFLWSILEDGSLQLHNRRLVVQSGTVHALCLTRKGDRLVAGVNHLHRSMMYSWDTSTGILLWSCEPHAGTMIMDIDISHDDSLIVSGGFYDFLVRLASTESGDELFLFYGHSGPLSSVKFNHDDSKIASCANDGCVFIWEVASRTTSKSFKNKEYGVLLCLDYSSDGSRLAIGNMNDNMIMFDAETGDNSMKIKHRGADDVKSLAYSNDGTVIASGGGDGLIKLWDSNRKRELFTLNGHKGGVDVVCFLPSWSCDEHEYVLK